PAVLSIVTFIPNLLGSNSTFISGGSWTPAKVTLSLSLAGVAKDYDWEALYKI
ncbi:unnamed protein product, partial [marine sediment metagenome]